MRIIALVVLENLEQITIVTNENETIENCLNRKKINWIKYLII